MTRTLRVICSVTALLVGACSELASPTRGDAYDWRLIVTFDSLGPQFDYFELPLATLAASGPHLG
jgi:hypothetical protein